MMDDLLDIIQAAEYLGDVSTRTVHRLVARGQLRKVKVGGSTRFRRSDLERCLRAGEREMRQRLA
jgi:excisionase family DNA binding protein